jgi:hypothetical protein
LSAATTARGPAGERDEARPEKWNLTLIAGPVFLSAVCGQRRALAELAGQSRLLEGNMSGRKLVAGFITTADIVERFNVSESTVRRLARARRLTKHRRPGVRDVLYSRQEVEAVLQPQPVAVSE